MELLVVMLVSVIVIGVCYYAYLIAYRQLGDYKKSSIKVNQIVILNSLLQIDFEKSKLAIKTTDGILFTFDKDKRHEYQMNADYILRTDNSVTDTFKIQASNIQYLFQSRKQEKVDSIIDEFLFEAKLFNNEEQFHFTKQYDAKTMIEF